MARWASTIEIAGVVLTGCRGILLDAAKFSTTYRGSIAWGNDGTADTQVIDVGQRGTLFGIQMDSLELIKVTDMVTAINTAQSTKSPFEVYLIDELNTVHVFAEVDYLAESWLVYGIPAQGYVPDVIIRLVSKGPWS